MMRSSSKSVARIKSETQHFLLFVCALMIAGCGTQTSIDPSPTPSGAAYEDSEKALALAYRGCVGPNVEYAYERAIEIGWMGQAADHGKNNGTVSDEWLETNADILEGFMFMSSYLTGAQQSAALLDPKWRPLADSYADAGRWAIEQFDKGFNIGESTDSIPIEYRSTYDAVCRIASSKAIEASSKRGLTLNQWTDEAAGELLLRVPEDWDNGS